MQLCSSLSILWHCLSLGLEWKLTFSSRVATAEFSKVAGILSAALSQHHHFMTNRWVSSGNSVRLYFGGLQNHCHDGVITHLEPDILECEVKWALGSITMNKASGGDGIPVELFQILKDDAVKVLHSICQQVWKTQQWPQDWKRSVFIPIPKKGNAKECSN